MIIELKLNGKIPSKKNDNLYQKRQNELNTLIWQLKMQKNESYKFPIETDYRVNAYIWDNNRKDANNQFSTICDILEKSGIIKNDRQVKEFCVKKIIRKRKFYAEIDIVY